MQLVNSMCGNMINDFGDSGWVLIEVWNWWYDDGIYFCYVYYIFQVVEMKGCFLCNKDQVLMFF